MSYVKGQRMQKPRKLILRFTLSAALVSLLFLIPNHLNAQATATRSRDAEASAFVTYSRVTLDYGPAGERRDHRRGLYQVSSRSSPRRSKFVSRPLPGRLWLRGPSAAVCAWNINGRYFHPYVDFLVSKGTITFANKNFLGSNGTGSNGSIVYSYGGGVDYDFADQWCRARGLSGRIVEFE